MKGTWGADKFEAAAKKLAFDAKEAGLVREALKERELDRLTLNVQRSRATCGETGRPRSYRTWRCVAVGSTPTDAGSDLGTSAPQPDA